jgi:hypothetical protein
MFEHLDAALAPLLVGDGGDYADLRHRTARLRRRRNVVATAVTMSVLVTGGVSGLALEGPEDVHAPIASGPLFAIGAPRSFAQAPSVSLSQSESTPPNACPSLASAGRPTSSAAVAVAVTEAVVVDPATADGSGSAAGGGSRSRTFGTPAQTAATTSSGSTNVAHVPVPRSSGSGGSSGGSQLPVVTIPDPPATQPPDPPVVTVPPVTDPSPVDSGTPSPPVTDSPGPIDPSPPVIDPLPSLDLPLP